MAKPFTCSKCGGSTKQILSPTEFKCVYCNTVFYEEKKEPVKPVINQSTFIDDADDVEEIEPREIKAIVITVLVLVVIGFFAFYSVHRSAKTEEQIVKDKQDEMNRYMKETDKMIDQTMEKLMPNFTDSILNDTTFHIPSY